MEHFAILLTSIKLPSAFKSFIFFCVCGHLTQVLLYVTKPPISTHVDVSSGARGLNFGLSLYQHPYFVYASSESSGESVNEPSLLVNAI